MSRRRRAVILALLAIVLGGLAASDVAGREAALQRSLGTPVTVLVTREEVAAGDAARPGGARCPPGARPVRAGRRVRRPRGHRGSEGRGRRSRRGRT